MSWNKDQFKKYDPEVEGYGNKKQWQRAFSSRMGFDEATRIIEEQPMTPWEILGVPKHATATEIKVAYRKAVMEWHPDRNSHREEEATEMMKKINASYTILTEK
jgi:DnaJ-class molecular chaperone